MVINNAYGSNESLREFCKALGISSEVWEKVDALDAEKVKDIVTKPHEWCQIELGNAVFLCVKSEDEKPDLLIEIGADEGPHIDLVCEYISRILDGEFFSEYLDEDWKH